MNKGMVYVIVSLLFATFFSTVSFAATLSVSISQQRVVMDSGQTNLLLANVSAGDGNYICAWTYNPLNRPTNIHSFANQSCSALFHGNLSDLASPDVITVNANDNISDTGSAQTFVAVKPGLKISITPSASSIFVGGSVTISNNTANSTIQFSGTPPYSFSYSVSPQTGVTEQGNGFTFADPGVYNVTETVNDSVGSSDSASTTITVLTPVAVAISTLNPNIEVGQASVISAQATGGTPPYSFAWFVNGVQNASSSSNTFTFSPTIPSTYHVYATATDQGQNKNTSSNLTISVVAAPSTSLSPQSSLISAGQSVTFTNSTTGGVAPYTYSYSENNTLGVTQSGNKLIFANAGSYKVTFTASDTNGVAATSSAVVTVTPPLTIATFTSNSYLISADQAIFLANTTTGGTGSNAYQYTVSPSTEFSQSGNSFSFTSFGNYLITLQVTDLSGETANSTVAIVVTAPLAITLMANRTAINTGQSVAFTNVTSGGTGHNVYSYSENNTSGVAQNGNKLTFGNPGNYLVTLTASDISGETASSQTLISVTAPAVNSCKHDKDDDDEWADTVLIIGNSKQETVQITDQQMVEIIGNSDNVTINMPGPNCNIAVGVIGNSNKVNIYNGTILLGETGNSNVATLHNTVVSAQFITGNSDKVTGAIVNGYLFLITGNSNFAESLQIENLSYLKLVGNGMNITANLLGTTSTYTSITGNFNIMHVTNGVLSLRIVGSSNNFYYHGTTITSQSITGSANKVIKD